MTAAESPEDTIRQFTRYVRERDLEKLVALYEPDAVFSPDPTVTVTGHDALRGAFRGFLATQPVLKVVPALVHTSGDTALVSNDWTLEAQGPGGAPTTSQGRSAVVLRRQASGAWLIAIDRL